jgi:LacI family asc operon transcriptional repressor
LQQEEQHGNDAGGGEARGVSKATVSRVLSGNGYVSQETKDRVFQAVAESGYRPNLLARNLATKRRNPGAGGDQHPVSRRLF